jgi:hypothetical protein
VELGGIILAIVIGILTAISLGVTFHILASSPTLLFTIVIPLILGVGLFYASWIFYYRENNVLRRETITVNGKNVIKIIRGKNVTSGFLAVAVGTAFFIPTLSLVTSYSEQATDINNIETWSIGETFVTISYPNPLSIPVKYNLENLDKNLTVKINHPQSVTVTSVDLLSPQDSIVSTSLNFTNSTKKLSSEISSSIANKSGVKVFTMPVNAIHNGELSNKTYNYSLIMGYTELSNKTNYNKQVTIPFNWTVITKDMPWLSYLWIVMAGVVASRFITFIADTKKNEPIDIDRAESLWIAFTFIIAVIAFASFKENVTLGSIVIFNVLASFAFGFGSQKVLELARAFPGTSISTPAQVTNLRSAAATSNQIQLEWDPNPETDIDHYNIYRGLASNFIIIAQAPNGVTPATSYTDTGLKNNTNFFYRVSAVNKDGGIGPHSAELATKTT